MNKLQKAALDRNISLDLLKICLAFMVVAQHTNFLFEDYLLCNYLLVNGLFRIAVPLFLIINGYYLFDTIKQGKSYIWLKRVVILYIVWMIFYSFLWLYIPYTIEDSMKLGMKILIGHFHLWYIAGMIVGGGLLFLTKNMSSFTMFILILLTFLCGVIIQYIGNYNYTGDIKINRLFNQNWVHRNAILFSYPFISLGYLLRRHSWGREWSRNRANILCFLGVCLLIFESYLNYISETRIGGFDNYLSLIIVCPLIFITVNNLGLTGKSKNVALYSSGIYFIHIFVMYCLLHLANFKSSTLTVLVILLSGVLSYFLIFLNKKIKFLL